MSTYKFQKPFKYGDEVISSVELKDEFDTGDMIRVMNAKGEGDKMGAMIVAATGWPLPKVAKIPLKETLQLSTKIADFFGDLPTTSETSGSET